MKLTVDYKKNEPKKGEEIESDIDTTVNLISYCVSKAYPDGFDGNGPLRRMYGRLQRKMEDAVESQTNELDLESAELDLVIKALKDAQTPIGWSKYMGALEDALHELPKSEA